MKKITRRHFIKEIEKLIRDAKQCEVERSSENSECRSEDQDNMMSFLASSKRQNVDHSSDEEVSYRRLF